MINPPKPDLGLWKS